MDPQPRAPGIGLWRLSAPLRTLTACGTARTCDDGVIELLLTEEEVATGGMATVSMAVRIADTDHWYSAWLAIPPGVADGTTILPSVTLAGMQPVRFRLRRAVR